MSSGDLKFYTGVASLFIIDHLTKVDIVNCARQVRREY